MCLFFSDISSEHTQHTGLFSSIMRDLAYMNNDCPKWIVLDGDIDPMWIESLNTVMDDNKVHVQVINFCPRILHHVVFCT